MPERELKGPRRRLLSWVAGVVASSALVAAGFAVAAEPNETPATATGPLTAGTTFKASLETVNDVDFQFFYLPDPAQVSVTVINDGKAKTKAERRGRTIATGLAQARKGKPALPIGAATAVIRPGQRSRVKLNLAPGKYLLPIAHADNGAEPLANVPFRIQIGPAGSTTDSYEIFARRCAAAVARVNRVHQSKKNIAARLRKAKRNDRDAKVRRLKAKLEQKRQMAKLAQRNKRIVCSVPR